ncbi:MAG: PD40 domain-containing protein [Flavobacteriales bacterium]|nr:PD40 domain-containing protein [Flavobacteriales bacterium]
MKKLSILVLLLVICVVKNVAQDAKRAADLFLVGNFGEALDEYLALLDDDPDNIEYNYNLAVCYLNTNIDKSLAIAPLEKITQNPKIIADAYYLLGRAYHYGYQFDKAIEMFNKFIASGKGSEMNRMDVDKQIEYCENARELMKFPKSVEFENLGPQINSRDDDYFPFVPADEKFVIFNSSREDRKREPLENGSYLPTVYISYVENGKFTEAVEVPGVKGSNDLKQEIVGLNGDGTKAVLYFEDFNFEGDLYESGIEGKGVKTPVALPDVINSGKYTEIAGCFTDDNQKFYFASNRPGGYGGVDIYMCQRLPNGNWSMAQNLGPTINTSQDEDFPNISPDGKYLFFSSKGHASMGGYDIFRAEWDDVKRKFTKVQNMGYPINTPEDNMNFRMSESGKYGYISAVRAGGYGDRDIYRVNFTDVEPKYTIIKGTVTNTLNKRFDDIFIQVVDAETDEIFGDYLPNDKTNRYVIILPPGNYYLYIAAYGYQEIYEDVEILDKSSFKSFIDKDFVMEPAEE